MDLINALREGITHESQRSTKSDDLYRGWLFDEAGKAISDTAVAMTTARDGIAIANSYVAFTQQDLDHTSVSPSSSITILIKERVLLGVKKNINDFSVPDNDFYFRNWRLHTPKSCLGCLENSHFSNVGRLRPVLAGRFSLSESAT